MMPVSLGIGSLLLLVSGGRSRLIIDDLEDIGADQTLQGLMVDIGVSDLTLLVGAEMKYLASWQGHPNGRLGLVPNRLHGGTS